MTLTTSFSCLLSAFSVSSFWPPCMHELRIAAEKMRVIERLRICFISVVLIVHYFSGERVQFVFGLKHLKDGVQVVRFSLQVIVIGGCKFDPRDHSLFIFSFQVFINVPGYLYIFLLIL